MITCHICRAEIDSTYADTCDRCAADPVAAFDDIQAAEEFQCTGGTWL